MFMFESKTGRINQRKAEAGTNDVDRTCSFLCYTCCINSFLLFCQKNKYLEIWKLKVKTHNKI